MAKGSHEEAIRLSPEAAAQIESLDEYYANLQGRGDPKPGACLAEASFMIANALDRELASPRPYPKLHMLGLAWLGLAWLGLAWLGLAWLGLAWLG